MERETEKKLLMKHYDFIFFDAVILLLTFFLACGIHSQKTNILAGEGNVYLHQTMCLMFALLCSLVFGNPYKDILKRGRLEEFKRTVSHAGKMLLVNLVGLYVLQETNDLSRIIFVLNWGLYIILEYLFRLAWKRHLQKRFTGVAGKRSMIVITSEKHVVKLLRNLNQNPLRPFFVTGVFLADLNETDYKTGDKIENVKILGDANEAIAYSTHNWVDDVTMDLRGDRDKVDVDYLLKQFAIMGITTNQIVARLLRDEKGDYKQYETRIGDYIATSRAVRYVSPVQKFGKRAIDIVGGLVGCILTLIITIFVGPAIYLKSPGPIFFNQMRVGKNGKLFKMYKFRSMYMDAEERKKELMAQNKIDGLMFKMDDDPRIIGSEKKGKDGKPKGIGNFIRKTSIDEFPQFFNVLKGDMSLVGTRPPTLDEWEQYTPEHRARITIPVSMISISDKHMYLSSPFVK